MLLLAVAVFAGPQQTSQSNQDKQKQDKNLPPPPPPQQQNQPAPLFGGQIGVKSSQKTKESASLGFNGIDPSGHVQQSMLATNATSTSTAEVKNMDTTRPTPVEVAAFIKEGKLKTR
jgi:hypothetical protein